MGLSVGALNAQTETFEFTQSERRGKPIPSVDDNTPKFDFQTIVSPVGELIGAPIKYSPGTGTWDYEIYPNNVFHYNLDNGLYDIPSGQPLYVFGNRYLDKELLVGEEPNQKVAEPLYTNRAYSVAVHIGRSANTQEANQEPFRIEYFGVDAATGKFKYIDAAEFMVSNPWANGYDNETYEERLAKGIDYYYHKIPGIGLELVFRPVQGTSTLGTVSENYIVTIKATRPDYYYSFMGKGYAVDGETLIPMSKNGSGAHVYQRLFDMSFVDQPDTIPDTLLKPSFDSEPMPPMYLGMSPDEIMDHLPAFSFSDTFNVETSSGSITNTQTGQFKELDHSPELRQHPILDDFVESMRGDLLALANYVQNEIELTDALIEARMHDPDDPTSEVRLGLRGISRSALAVFQEEQGSPIEQCALLVYLFRKAGVPAFYMEPEANQMKLLDSQIAAMLGIQVEEFNQNSLIAVNYPFVAAFIEGKYQYFFPWIKDTEVVEGFNLYDLMPAKWNSAYKWFYGYIHNDPEINSLDESDQPDILWPKFIEAQLQQYYPFVSLDDVGINLRNRTQFYPTFEDFPRPVFLSGIPTGFESYGLPDYRSKFNKKRLEITVAFDFNNDGTSSDVIFDSGSEWLECDLHNRRFFAYAKDFTHDGPGSGIYRLPYYIVLQPYRPGETDYLTDMSSVDPFAENSDVVNGFRKKVELAIDGGSGQPVSSFFRNSSYKETQTIVTEIPSGSGSPWSISTVYAPNASSFRYADSVAFSSNTGRVTERMLDVHAQDIWANQQNRDKEIDHGANLYLQGQLYWKRRGDFYQLVDDMHKIQRLRPSTGLARMKINILTADAGRLQYSIPQVDVQDGYTPVIWGGDVHPRNQEHGSTYRYEAEIISSIGGSAFEHGVIQDFWQGVEASSTMQVLRSVDNPVLLTYDNYAREGAEIYNNQTLIQQLSSSQPSSDIWDDAIQVFDESLTDHEFSFVWVTPGLVPLGNAHFRASAKFRSGRRSVGYRIGTNSGITANGGIAYVNLGDPIGRFLRLEYLSYGKGKTSPTYKSVPADGSGDSGGEAQSASAPPDTVNNSAAEIAAATVAKPPVSTDLQTNQAQGFHNNVNNSGEAATQEQNGGPAMTVLNNGEVDGAYGDPVNIKTGAFFIDEVDVSLPGPFPLELRRNYNSQDASRGHFGWAWKLSFVPFLVINDDGTKIRAAELNGDVIEYRKTATGPGDPFLELWQPDLEDNPNMTNNNMDGIGSLANPFNNSIIKIQEQGNDGIWRDFYNLYGPDGSVRKYMVMSFEQGGLNRTRPYLVSWWDNRLNCLEFSYGDEKDHPSWGQLTRVSGSSGVFLNFRYDAYGRIFEANTSDGRWFRYEYDKHNTLRRVVRPDNSSVRYEYEIKSVQDEGTEIQYSTFAITKVENPDGRVLLNEYDEQQRVIKQKATVGKDLIPIRNATTTYSEEDKGGKTFQTNTVTDVFGNKTVYKIYDGMITSITDPLGQTEYRNYFTGTTEYFDAKAEALKSNGVSGFPRSLQMTVDKRGLKTKYQYDNRGNLRVVDRTGHFDGTDLVETVRTTYAYDDKNRLIKIQGPQIEKDDSKYREISEFVYDLTDTERASGVEFTNLTDSMRADIKEHAYLPKLIIKRNGNQLLSATYRSYKNVIAGSYFANGLLKEEIRAFGSDDAATTEFDYGTSLPLGFANERTSFTGTDDVDVTVELLHSQRGEVVKEVAPDGTITRYDYDTMSRLIGTRVFDDSTNTAGEPISWNFNYYNENGEVSWSDGPGYGTNDNGAEDYVFRDYDGAGRLIAELVWRTQANEAGDGVEAVPDQHVFEGQAMTTYQYDGFGNLTSMIDPNGNVTIYEYDELGRRTYMQVSDSENGVLTFESYEYESGNEIAKMTNAEGGVTEYLYTSTGQPYYQKNPDGTIQKWEYHKDGRINKEKHPNGTVTQYVYDDNSFTVKTAIQNSGYTPADPNDDDPTTTVITDRRGNVISTTDIAGNTFTTEYDGLDRVKKTLGPLLSNQLIETYNYDPVDRKVTVTNAVNERVETRSDRLGRTTLTRILDVSGGSENEIERTKTEYSADFYSSTTSRGITEQVKTTTWVNTFGQPVIVRYDDDTPGNDSDNPYTKATYDRNGNIIESQDELKQISIFSFDGLNRPKTTTTPDGATTILNYNLIGNLDERIMPGGLAWSATYDQAGRMKTEALTHNSKTTRDFRYFHYSSQDSDKKQRARLRKMRDQLRNIDYDYSDYDGFGRLVEMKTNGSSDVYHLTQTMSYDLRGNLTNLKQDYTDSSLDDTEIIRGYDDYSRLLTEQIKRGSSTHSYLAQSWDNAGRRQDLRRNGTPAGTPELSFGYTAAGRMGEVISRVGGSSRTFGFQYDTAGFLNIRTNPFRWREITDRDSRGRPTDVLTSVTELAIPFLIETGIQWRDDSKLKQFSITRTGAAIGSEDRVFEYNTRGQLTQEKLNRTASKVISINYGFDDQKLGVMKSMTVDDPLPGGGGFSARIGDFMRLNSVNVGGQSVALSGSISSVGEGFVLQYNKDGGGWQAITDYRWTNEEAGAWEADITFDAGSYQLEAAALHESSLYISPKDGKKKFEVGDPTTDSSTVNFTVSSEYAGDPVSQTYDAAGYTTARSWTGGQVQVFKWDALGRLIKLDQTVVAPFAFEAVYDGAGRRIRSEYTPSGGSTVVEECLFDPLVEFLELAVKTQGSWVWKIHGPDMGAGYGSLQGIGGIEAFIEEGSGGEALGAVTDLLGNVVATINTSNTVSWSDTLISAYGPLPGTNVYHLDGTGASPVQALAAATTWRSMRIDPTDYLCMGTRYYDSLAGRFMSPDPLGHAASMDLYSYANGDPINFVDPTGRKPVGVPEGNDDPTGKSIEEIEKEIWYAQIAYEQGFSNKTGYLKTLEKLEQDASKAFQAGVGQIIDQIGASSVLSNEFIAMQLADFIGIFDETGLGFVTNIKFSAPGDGGWMQEITDPAQRALLLMSFHEGLGNIARGFSDFSAWENASGLGQMQNNFERIDMGNSLSAGFGFLLFSGRPISAMRTSASTASSRVFWSGGQQARSAAEAFAKANGGKTLEMTLPGKFLDTITTKHTYPLLKPLWDRASLNFAKGAGPKVDVFQSGSRGVRLESVWTTKEYPQLIKQGTEINYHIAP